MLLRGERHAAFSSCSGCSISWAGSHVRFAGMKGTLHSGHGLSLFMGFFFFPCLISFPFLSTILKNGMDGGEKHFHVKM